MSTSNHSDDHQANKSQAGADRSDPTDRSSEEFNFAPWHLTAYALGELDETTQKGLEAWLALHPEGLKEIEATKSLARRLEQELARLPEGLELEPVRLRKVQEAIASSGSIRPSDALLEVDDSLNKRNRRKRWAMAMATGLVAGLGATAFWISRPDGERLAVQTLDWNRTSESKKENQEQDLSLQESLGKPADRFGVDSPAALSNSSSDGLSDDGLSKKETNSSEPRFLGRRIEEQRDKSPAALDPMVAELWGSKVAEPQKQLARGLESEAVLGMDIAPSGGGLGASPARPAGPAGRSSIAQEERELRREWLERQRSRLDATSNRGRFAKSDQAEYAMSDQAKGIDDYVDRLTDAPAFPEELSSNVPSRRILDSVPETPFEAVLKEPLSTFSIDVDTASYSKLRQYVLENRVLPSPSTIRIEEWLNYFDYGYPGPVGDEPFAAHMKMGDCPWNSKHRLVRVAIQAKKVANEDRPNSNLVFLIDVSGSMADANKLPLVKRTLGLLLAQLRAQDRVAIVVYAGAAGCVLPSTSGDRKDRIFESIDELQSGGSTNGGQGIELAYKIAKENFIPGGINRVVLCTDGDFNVGVTGTEALVSMMQEQAKSNVFLTCLGYGIGNYNDSMMEQVSNQGNGTYAMVDSELEARRVMTEQLSGTLMTVAKDVKIQVEFNPAKVHSYRLIGYENRRLAAADFNNDKKDAGEIGAGHRVTALYEIVPVGQVGTIPGKVDDLRYSKSSPESPRAAGGLGQESNEWMFLKIRSKRPESNESTKQEFTLTEVVTQEAYEGEQRDYDWATSVAEFGLLMRRSELAPDMQWEKMLGRAMDSAGQDAYRRECISIMQRSRDLMTK